MEHPLETNETERDYFLRASISSSERGAYRRALEATTGSLPSWAQRHPGGCPQTFDAAAAVALYRAGGLSLEYVGKRYGVSAQAIRYHVRKAAAAA
ncbi:MAG: hypothetical protein EPN61_17550 [Burkholderiaceae bacterium]|nr:MAG: hypothetical protein EPN61_17550 [Burkholderiaceae bacterium]